jgi:hypothetical protein
VLQELRSEGLIDTRNATELETTLNLVCLMVTHGWRGNDTSNVFQMRQLVRLGSVAGDDSTELPYPFEADSETPHQPFGFAAWTAHSCAPNVWAAGFAPPQALTLVARRDIRAGDRITFSLVDKGLDTGVRQQLLQRLCGLDCDCERCRRPCPAAMLPSPLGPCATCGHKLIGQHGRSWQCGACGARVAQQLLDRASFEPRAAAAKISQIGEEQQALQEAAQAAGELPQYGALRRIQRLAAEAESAAGACNVVVGDRVHMLSKLYFSVATKAQSAPGGILPRSLATRGWPANMPRSAAALLALSAQSAMNGARLEECRAAQCTEGGGAGCSVEHPVISGNALCTALIAALNLRHAVAAARSSAVGEGPAATLAELHSVLVSDAGIPEASADVLLAHLRRYAHPLQLMQGAQTLTILEVLVMLQAPLRCLTEAPLWCAGCCKLEVYGRTKWCSRWQCVRYCSRECQTDDWRGRHKRSCRGLAALRCGSAGSSSDGIGVEQL